jgi:hypothetical protein
MHIKLCQQVAKVVEGGIINTLTIVGIKFNGLESERCINVLYNSLFSSILCLLFFHHLYFFVVLEPFFDSHEIQQT